MGDVLAFGGQLERSLEVLLVTMLGVLVSVHWDWRAVPLGLALFLLIRPLSVMLLMPRRYLDRAQSLTAGWFGIRGIGSLYYLSYAVTLACCRTKRMTIIGLVLSVVALSIVLHGLSTQPLLRRYERSRGCRRLNGGRAWRSAVLEAEADLHSHLEVTDLAVLDMTANLASLEPLDVLQLAAGFGDTVLDRLIDAVARGADDFNLLVRVMIRR